MPIDTDELDRDGPTATLESVARWILGSDSFTMSHDDRADLAEAILEASAAYNQAITMRVSR